MLCRVCKLLKRSNRQGQPATAQLHICSSARNCLAQQETTNNTHISQLRNGVDKNSSNQRDAAKWLACASEQLAVLDKEVVAPQEGPATKSRLSEAAKCAKVGKQLEISLGSDQAASKG